MNEFSSVNNSGGEELSLFDILSFLRRQGAFLLGLSFFIFLFVVAYGLTRATTWETKGTLIIGERLFFSQSQQQQQQQQYQQQLIESVDEIRHRYSDDVKISNLKNSRIIELVATSTSRQASIDGFKKVRDEIVASHKLYLAAKKDSFMEFLHVVGGGKSRDLEMIRLLDAASNSNQTRQIGQEVTNELRYGGKLGKILFLGFAFAFFMALILAVFKDFLDRNRDVRQHS